MNDGGPLPQRGSRRAAVTGVIRVAIARVGHRLTNGGSRQSLLSVIGVGLAVALVLTVTSVGLGLAAQGTVQTASADYWIVPEEAQGSAVTGVEGTRFGQVHPVTERLTRLDSVAYATPVLFDVTRVQSTSDGDPTRVFIVGVIPSESGETVVGLSTGALSAGDPYYANGSYNGTWTGEAVVSASAADLLAIEEGDEVEPVSSRSDQRVSVVDVSQAQSPGIAQFPVLVVHLAEAQQLVGAANNDKADQILVDARDRSAREELATVYPQSEVVSRSGLFTHELRQSDLPYAMSLAAGIIAVVVGTLAIVTTVGFEVLDDAPSRAVLAAVGLSGSTRWGLIMIETIVTSLVGGLAGIAGWLLALGVIEGLGTIVSSVPTVVFLPRLAVGGLLLALGIGIISVPIVFLFVNRGPLVEVLPSQ